MPRLIGLKLAKAQAQIESATCAVGHVRRTRSIKRRRGKVIGQAPRAGAMRPIGASVSVVIGRK